MRRLRVRSPGAHPLDFAREVPPGATPETAAEAWAEVPGAAMLLPVGRTFDVLDVPEAAVSAPWCGWSAWEYRWAPSR